MDLKQNYRRTLTWLRYLQVTMVWELVFSKIGFLAIQDPKLQRQLNDLTGLKAGIPWQSMPTEFVCDALTPVPVNAMLAGENQYYAHLAWSKLAMVGSSVQRYLKAFLQLHYGASAHDDSWFDGLNSLQIVAQLDLSTVKHAEDIADIIDYQRSWDSHEDHTTGPSIADTLKYMVLAEAFVIEIERTKNQRAQPLFNQWVSND